MPVSDISHYFKPELFAPHMQATTKDEALEELLDLFVEAKEVKDKHIVLDMLKQRETLGSTGIGKGIAIPHGRTTATGDILVAFGTSDNGIDFDAMDGEPVHLFFMVIAPPNDEGNIYLPLLGSLVTSLKKAAVRKKLQAVEEFDDLAAIIDGDIQS